MDFQTLLQQQQPMSTGSSKQRRNQLKIETVKLGVELPLDYGKISQLRTLKAACVLLRKEKHFANFKQKLHHLNYFNQQIDCSYSNHDNFLSEGLLGFYVCFSRKGELIYLSENIIDYLGFKSMEILLSYDLIHELAHKQDRNAYETLLTNYANCNQTFSFYSLWFVSKIKRKTQPPLSEYKLFKLNGKYDPETDMFVFRCTPILSIGNRDSLISCEPKYFSSAHHLDLKFSELSRNGENLLGYVNMSVELEKLSFYDVVCPDYLHLVRERHQYLLNSKDLKGHLDPIKLLHANGSYVDCLLNMYYDNRGFIICKYQAMSLNDITKYSEYVSKLDLDWFLNSPSFDSDDSSGDADDNSYDLDDEYDDLSEVTSCTSYSSSVATASATQIAILADSVAPLPPAKKQRINKSNNKRKFVDDESSPSTSSSSSPYLNNFSSLSSSNDSEINYDDYKPPTTVAAKKSRKTTTQSEQQQQSPFVAMNFHNNNNINNNNNKLEFNFMATINQQQTPINNSSSSSSNKTDDDEEIQIKNIKSLLEQEMKNFQSFNKTEQFSAGMNSNLNASSSSSVLDYENDVLDDNDVRNFLQFCENLNDLNLTYAAAAAAAADSSPNMKLQQQQQQQQSAVHYSDFANSNNSTNRLSGGGLMIDYDSFNYGISAGVAGVTVINNRNHNFYYSPANQLVN